MTNDTQVEHRIYDPREVLLQVLGKKPSFDDLVAFVESEQRHADIRVRCDAITVEGVERLETGQHHVKITFERRNETTVGYAISLEGRYTSEKE